MHQSIPDILLNLALGTGCRKYIQCSNGGVAATRICPEGTVYTGDVRKGGICNWASMVICADQDGVLHPTFLPSYEESAEGVPQPAAPGPLTKLIAMPKN